MSNVLLKPCTYFYVYLDSNSNPIPGTMFSTNSAKIPTGKPCRIAAVPPYQMIAPAGKHQCFKIADNNLRFFYKYNTFTKQIVPNSMFSYKGAPNNKCSGQEQLLEFKTWF